jgi:hypothetical protein
MLDGIGYLAGAFIATRMMVKDRERDEIINEKIRKRNAINDQMKTITKMYHEGEISDKYYDRKFYELKAERDNINVEYEKINEKDSITREKLVLGKMYEKKEISWEYYDRKYKELTAKWNNASW